MTIVADPLNVIYGLHSTDGVIRYVGQTSLGLAHRMKSHRLGGNKHLPVAKWIKSHGQETIEATVLATAASVDELDDIEVKWIEELHTRIADGGMNITAGGKGVRGMTWSAEKRAAQSKRLQGEGHPRWGHANSPEMRAKISAANRGKMGGENGGNHKLKTTQVLEIVQRRALGETLVAIAADYDISANQVSWIFLGKSWSSVTGIVYDAERIRHDKQVATLKREIDRRYTAAYRKANRAPRPLMSAEARAKLSKAKQGKSGMNKITEDQAREIKVRLAAGESQPSLALAFGLHHASISDIKRGLTWAWVTT